MEGILFSLAGFFLDCKLDYYSRINKYGILWADSEADREQLWAAAHFTLALWNNSQSHWFI